MKIRQVATLALVLSLAGVVQSGAITWGMPDGEEHPHVGTLLFVQNGVGFFSCTGTLIAPKVMLTAGHCVESLGQLNDITYVRFDEDALSGIGDYGSLQAWFAAEWIVADVVIPHPQFDDYSGFPFTYDVGIVILSEEVCPPDGVGGCLYGELPDEGFLETLRGREKNRFTVVGYGRQGNLKPTNMNDYERYKGKMKLIEINSLLTAKGQASAKFTNNPGIGGGTCYGDSGGPTFFRNGSMVVAVTSFGWAKNGYCVGNQFHYRVDTPDALDFIYEQLDMYGPDPD